MHNELEASRRYFEDTVKSVPEDESSLRLAPETWSILGIVEHIVIAERALLGRFNEAEKCESSLRDPDREAQFAVKLRNRTVPFKAPERAWPTGRFATLGEALGHFMSARNQTVRFAAEREGELYNLRVTHPFFGPVNGVEMLMIVAAHSSRHADQILEIRARCAQQPS